MSPISATASRRTVRSALAAGVVCMISGLVVLMAGVLPSAGTPNPPGNNGTIKVDNEPFDNDPDNEPHVDCVFQVDFYGYDEGDLDAAVIFEAHPPTLRPGDDQVLLIDTVFIGEDDNSGGGSEAGLDASETYVLDFTGITPHPVQGFHVKLTIHAEGSQGSDTKHKVFWVTECVQPTTPPTSPPPTEPTSPPPTEPTSPPPTEPTSPPPTEPTSPPPSETPKMKETTPPGEELPTTGGSGNGWLAALGAGLLLAGTGLVLAGRQAGRHQA